MTLLSQSQGRGYALTEASLSTRNVRSSTLTCTNTVSGACRPGTMDRSASSRCTPSIFQTCPMCGNEPVEPVRVEGQLACQSCTSACTICSWPCVPGDEVCSECVRHVGLQPEAVLL